MQSIRRRRSASKCSGRQLVRCGKKKGYGYCASPHRKKKSGGSSLSPRLGTAFAAGKIAAALRKYSAKRQGGGGARSPRMGSAFAAGKIAAALRKYSSKRKKPPASKRARSPSPPARRTSSRLAGRN